MHHSLDNIYAGKELYHHIMSPVCTKYCISPTEMLVVLFLANNPQLDTATDIVGHRHLTKSSVSMAVKGLLSKKLVETVTLGDHRVAHIKLCPAATEIVKEGALAQKKFFSVFFDGFSAEEKEILMGFLCRMTQNVDSYLKG